MSTLHILPPGARPTSRRLQPSRHQPHDPQHLAAQAFAGAGVLWVLWVLYALVAAQAALGAVAAPARQTFLPRLLPADQLTAGAALQMLAGRAGWVVGPALGGLVTAAGGLRFCYLADAVSFVAALYGALGLPPARPESSGGRDRGLRAIAEGLRFVRRSRVLTGALLADICATVLAVPVALFPAIDVHRFGGDPRALGLMGTAMAVGGIIGSALSGPVGRVQRQGRGMLAAVATWGLAIAVFGIADSLVLTLLTLAVADAADVSSLALRATVIQAATPEAFRGRVAATDYVVGGAVPQLGNFRAGPGWSPAPQHRASAPSPVASPASRPQASSSSAFPPSSSTRPARPPGPPQQAVPVPPEGHGTFGVVPCHVIGGPIYRPGREH